MKQTNKQTNESPIKENRQQTNKQHMIDGFFLDEF
jgi:hypothetical protein